VVMNNRHWGADQGSRRIIDVAVGVLVALRGCTEDEAFEDLAHAVHETGVGPGSIARALVELAMGASSDTSDCHRQALGVWGPLLERRMPTVDAARI
jgi:hypothetical protein